MGGRARVSLGGRSRVRVGMGQGDEQSKGRVRLIGLGVGLYPKVAGYRTEVPLIF